MGDGTDDFVTRADPVVTQWTPTASDGVDVGAADTTVGDGEGDIVRALGLELEVSDREVLVVLGVYPCQTLVRNGLGEEGREGWMGGRKETKKQRERKGEQRTRGKRTHQRHRNLFREWELETFL